MFSNLIFIYNLRIFTVYKIIRTNVQMEIVYSFISFCFCLVLGRNIINQYSSSNNFSILFFIFLISYLCNKQKVNIYFIPITGYRLGNNNASWFVFKRILEYYGCRGSDLRVDFIGHGNYVRNI